MTLGSFGFWANEDMTVEFADLNLSRVLGEPNLPKTGKCYFGSPQNFGKLQAETGAGVTNIQVFPQFNLPDIERNKAYDIGIKNDYHVNGFVYRLLTAGTTAASSVAYPQALGATVTDGTAVFRCVSAAHKTTEIKFAMSQSDLETAIAGAALSIGNTINAGSAIPIYYSILDSVDNVFNDSQTPQLCFAITPCVETA